MRREADPALVAWLDAQPPESIWTTALTVFEIRFGLGILAKGRKRKALEEAFASALDEDFEGRVLALDQAATDAAAAIAARQRKPGVRSRFATSESPASPPRAKPRSPHATPVTLGGQGLR